MDISLLQDLVDNKSVDELSAAEDALLIEGKMPFDLLVADDAEALDLLSAAIWIAERMSSHEHTFDQAFQEYINR